MSTSSSSIIIYEAKDGSIKLDAKLVDDTIWLSQAEIASLFSVQLPAISKHITNIYKEKELEKKSTLSEMETVRKEGKRTVKRTVEHFNLDMIVSIGYRVNSKRATQFRIWATNILRQHLTKGYTLNPHQLPAAKMQELQSAVSLIKKAMERKELSGDEASGLLKIITEYADTWLLLDQFDRASLEAPTKSHTTQYRLQYDEAISIISALKKNLLRQKQATEIFGQERGDGLKRILGAIEQSFDGENLYTSIEQKASHLLYFLTKDHPFVDGNKRIAAFLFIVYLTKTHYFTGWNGERKFNDTALTALVLLIAESDPKEKELLITLIMHFVHG
jgi:prophage maintenance system killer protein